MRKTKRSDINVPNIEELVRLKTWVLVDGKTVQKDEWITKAQQASMAEELESEERLVYDSGGLPKFEID